MYIIGPPNGRHVVRQRINKPKLLLMLGMVSVVRRKQKLSTDFVVTEKEAKSK
jgi:hypothetical protein